MIKKSRRWKWSACSYTVYGVSEVERNSRHETVERAPLQDRSRSRWLCYLDIRVDVSPKRRDHAQHPHRRCQQGGNENRWCTKPKQTGSCANPPSETNACLRPDRAGPAVHWLQFSDPPATGASNALWLMIASRPLFLACFLSAGWKIMRHALGLAVQSSRRRRPRWRREWVFHGRCAARLFVYRCSERRNVMALSTPRRPSFFWAP